MQNQEIPLAVPMVADATQSSVTRNDAKEITTNRQRRLKVLQGLNTLSHAQEKEMKRIIRLEKNRLAAASSRQKRRNYVKKLEEKHELMCQRIARLEIENAHLIHLLNTTQNFNGRPAYHPVPQYPQSFGGSFDGPPIKRRRMERFSMQPIAQSFTVPPPPPIADVDEDDDLLFLKHEEPLPKEEVTKEEYMPLNALICNNDEDFMSVLDAPPLPTVFGDDDEVLPLPLILDEIEEDVEEVVEETGSVLMPAI